MTVSLSAKHIKMTFGLESSFQSSTDLIPSKVVGAAKTIDVVSTFSFNTNCPGKPQIIVTHPLNDRKVAFASANVAASLDLDRDGLTDEHQLTSTLEIKIRRCILSMYYLLSTSYKTGCPTLLDQTNAQYVVGWDGLQGLHSCLTPNAYIFTQPQEILRGLKDYVKSYVQKNMAALQSIHKMISIQETRPITAVELKMMGEQIKFLLFNLDLMDALNLLDPECLEYCEIEQKIIDIKSNLIFLRNSFRDCITENDSHGVREIEIDCFKLNEFLSNEVNICAFSCLNKGFESFISAFLDQIKEEHLVLKKEESLLENTHLQLNMNGGDVLPAIINYFDGDIIEAALRWRNISQMNRCAAGEGVFESMEYMIDYLKFIISRSDSIIAQERCLLKSFQKFEEEWQQTEAEFKKDLEGLIRADDAEFESKLILLKNSFKKTLKLIIDIKLSEKMIKDNDQAIEKYALEMKKEGKNLDEALEFFEKCKKEKLISPEIELKDYKFSINIVSSIITNRLKPYAPLFSSFAKFQPGRVGEKESSFWEKLINNSMQFDEQFDLIFKFFDKIPPAKNKGQFFPFKKNLQNCARDLSQGIEGIYAEQTQMAQMSAKQLHQELDHCTIDSARAVPFLKKICERIIFGKDSDRVKMDLLRLVHQVLVDRLQHSPGNWIQPLFEFDQLRIPLNHKYYFYLSKKELALQEIKLSMEDSLPDVGELGIFASIFGPLSTFEQSTIVECIQKAEQALNDPSHLSIDESTLSHAKCYVDRLKLALRLYEQEISLNQGSLSETFKGIFNFEGIKNGHFFSAKGMGLNSPQLPSPWELGEEYKKVFEVLQNATTLENSETLVEGAIEKATELLKMKTPGKSEVSGHAVQCYIHRLTLSLRISRYLKEIIKDHPLKSVRDAAIRLMKNYNFRLIQDGEFFQQFQSFLFPSTAVVQVDENNKMVLNGKGGAVDQSGKTQFKRIGEFLSLFFDFCGEDRDFLQKTITENKTKWMKEINKTKKAESKKPISLIEIDEDLALLKEKVLPVYSDVLKREFSCPSLLDQLQESIITEFNHEHLNSRVEKQLFRENLYALGADFLFQWFTSAVVGRRVEHLSSSRPLPFVNKARPVDKPFPLDFLVTFERDGEKQCSIQFAGEKVPFAGERLSKIMENVFQDIKELSERVKDWSIPTQFTVKSIVKPFLIN